MIIIILAIIILFVEVENLGLSDMMMSLTLAEQKQMAPTSPLKFQLVIDTKFNR